MLHPLTEEAGFENYIAAGHKGAIYMLWLHFWKPSCRPSFYKVYGLNIYGHQTLNSELNSFSLSLLLLVEFSREPGKQRQSCNVNISASVCYMDVLQ